MLSAPTVRLRHFVRNAVLASVPLWGSSARKIMEGPNEKTTLVQSRSGAPTGIRTPVLALKGPRPGPLDDGGAWLSE